MLIKIKALEALHHLDYIEAEFTRLQSTTHPNLRARLAEILQKETSTYRTQTQALLADIEQYITTTRPAIDTWKQLYSAVADVSRNVHRLRTFELPAYLASSADDHYFSTLFSAIHDEIGLHGTSPVVSLAQAHWFAVAGSTPQFPLYFVPSSIAADLYELPLVYHEIGHVLFRLWGDAFSRPLYDVVQSTIVRKTQEVFLIADPGLRTRTQQDLSELRVKLVQELEELTCDIVGTLLGGTSFGIALSIALFWTGTSNPYSYTSPQYPPLDCRMRITTAVLRQIGASDQICSYLDKNWANVRGMHRPPRWYNWIYDDVLFSELIAAVRSHLENKQIIMFDNGSGHIRETLKDGLENLILNPEMNNNWLNTTNNDFRSDYSSVEASGISSQSSSIPSSNSNA